MSAAYDAIVIGAGHNGLVAAAHLARAGRRVVVLERREIVGGAACTEEIAPGYRCDTGAHRIGALRPEVVRDLGLGPDAVHVLRPDPAVFAPHPDGPGLLLSRRPDAAAAAIRRLSPTDAERWPEFTGRMARVTRFLSDLHATTPPRLVGAGRSELRDLLRLGGRLRLSGRQATADALRVPPMSAADLLNEWFEGDLLKGALAGRAVTGLFQGPRAPGTACTLLHDHVGAAGDSPGSVRLVRGGTGRLAGALANAARQAGAEIRTAAAVEAIVARDGRAAGVVLAGGERVTARTIVSGVDPRRTFLELVDPADLDAGFLREVRRIRFRGATAKLHLALSELPRFAGMPDDGPHLRGAIVIAPSIDAVERAYDDAKYGRISRRPYLEAVIPSLHEPALAPEGRHVMSVLVQYAPYHLEAGAWDDARRDLLADRALATLGEYAPNLPDAIVARHVVSPVDLERAYGMSEGSIYHGELGLDQLFVMRPVPGWARYATPIDGLYLCGAGTHPGGGITGSSGYNAAREILRST